MIALVTGPPGAGKSFYAINKLAAAMDSGKFVGTNVALVDDVGRRIARRNLVRWLIPGRRARVAERVRSHTVVADELAELFRLRLPGTKEGRGVMVLDEASGWLNAREWSRDDRADVIRFFSQHRKLGWDVYLIVQDAEMLDKQVRNLIEYHVHLKNLRKARIMGVPFCPINVFIANWVWHSGGPRKVARREVARLNGSRKLYDTHQVHAHGAEDDPDVVWLPLPPPENAAGSGERSESGPGGSKAERAGSEPTSGADASAAEPLAVSVARNPSSAPVEPPRRPQAPPQGRSRPRSPSLTSRG